jgi:Raf kinase inhibitor-like YbhB/YbcL family protein
MTLALRSSTFQHNSTMPALYTCEGENISPPLSWGAPPAGTKSLVLIVDDPDAPDPAAPKMTWVHWVLYNLPPIATTLQAGVNEVELPAGTLVGINDRKNVGYNGPCPPVGTHRYFHKLYAVDIVLPDLRAPTKADVLTRIEGHVLEYSELVGLYQLKK